MCSSRRTSGTRRSNAYTQRSGVGYQEDTWEGSFDSGTLKSFEDSAILPCCHYSFGLSRESEPRSKVSRDKSMCFSPSFVFYSLYVFCIVTQHTLPCRLPRVSRLSKFSNYTSSTRNEEHVLTGPHQLTTFSIFGTCSALYSPYPLSSFITSLRS